MPIVSELRKMPCLETVCCLRVRWNLVDSRINFPGSSPLDTSSRSVFRSDRYILNRTGQKDREDASTPRNSDNLRKAQGQLEATTPVARECDKSFPSIKTRLDGVEVLIGRELCWAGQESFVSCYL